MRLRLWGRTPRSSRRPDRSRRSEEPELKSPQLRRWRLSRPGRPHGFRRIWKGTQERLWYGPTASLSQGSSLGSYHLPAFVHGLRSQPGLGISWTSGGNERPGLGLASFLSGLPGNGQVQDLKAGEPSGRWAQGGVSQLSGRVTTWGKGSGLGGRGKLQNRALQRENVGVQGELNSTPPDPTATHHTPDLYLQRKRRQLLPPALWYKGP